VSDSSLSELVAQVAPGVVLAGTLDTKSEEIGYVVEAMRRRGLATIVIDCGILGTPGMAATVDRESVARAAGCDLAALRHGRNREEAIPAMGRGLAAVLEALLATGKVRGFFGIGGGTGAALAAAAFRVLPFGLPKLLVTTVASGDTRPYVGMKDVVLIHSVVDVLGLNDFLRRLLRQAAAAMAALLAEGPEARQAGRLCVGMTSYGSTTPAAMRAWENLTGRGFEVMTFHARGIGGQAMEELIRQDAVQAVLDLTTTEIADEIVGGINSAGPDRLTAAGRKALPQVVLPGAIDMVNFGARGSVPQRFAGRNLVFHTPYATLMRTTPSENVAMAEFMAERLNAARGPVTVVIPLRGFSAYDSEGAPFFDPEADRVFRETLAARLAPRIAVRCIDAHINDPACVDVATELLLEMIGTNEQGRMR
jgi:uncharacterized protein (UPF0261 family)